MNIAFFGTGEFSKNILKDLIKNETINTKLVVSKTDKYIGRKKILTQTPIKIFAQDNDIEVYQPTKLKDNPELLNKLKNLDFIIVVAYGRIIPKEILDLPKYGAINIHGSILPSYRGASPIQEALKNGDTKTGLTIMYMSEGMDEGNILNIEEIPIDIIDKTQDIFKKFEIFGANLLLKTLNQIISGEIKSIAQDDSKATYCSKISKKDGLIDFEKQTSLDVYNNFRAYSPWPGIYTYYKNKKFSIEDCFFIENQENNNIGGVTLIQNGEKQGFGIFCKTGILILKEIKLEGKKTMDINSFINGNKDFINYKF